MPRAKAREVDYYNDIARTVVNLIRANLSGDNQYRVYPLIGDPNSAVRTLASNGYDIGEQVVEYVHGMHRLFLDVSVVVENLINRKFEFVIFEVKVGGVVGLTELSQLIGYCLVSKVKFGILLNIDDSISANFSMILNSDPDLTTIRRLLMDGRTISHELGVMIYDSEAQNLLYTSVGPLPSVAQLVQKIEDSIR